MAAFLSFPPYTRANGHHVNAQIWAAGGRGQNVWLATRPAARKAKLTEMFFPNRFCARKSSPRKSTSLSLDLYPSPCFKLDDAHALRNRRLMSPTEGRGHHRPVGGMAQASLTPILNNFGVQTVPECLSPMVYVCVCVCVCKLLPTSLP